MLSLTLSKESQQYPVEGILFLSVRGMAVPREDLQACLWYQLLGFDGPSQGIVGIITAPYHESRHFELGQLIQAHPACLHMPHSLGGALTCADSKQHCPGSFPSDPAY